MMIKAFSRTLLAIAAFTVAPSVSAADVQGFYFGWITRCLRADMGEDRSEALDVSETDERIERFVPHVLGRGPREGAHGAKGGLGFAPE